MRNSAQAPKGRHTHDEWRALVERTLTRMEARSVSEGQSNAARAALSGFLTIVCCPGRPQRPGQRIRRRALPHRARFGCRHTSSFDGGERSHAGRTEPRDRPPEIICFRSAAGKKPFSRQMIRTLARYFKAGLSRPHRQSLIGPRRLTNDSLRMRRRSQHEHHVRVCRAPNVANEKPDAPSSGRADRS